MNKYLNYFKTSIKLSFLSLKEYKINFYSVIFTQIFAVGPFLLFSLFLGQNFANTIKWNTIDFILFGVLIIILQGLTLMFFNLPLFHSISSGYFNSSLTKPIKIFFVQMMNFSSMNFLFVIINLAMVFFIFKIGNYNFLNIMSGLLWLPVVAINSILFNQFIQSFEFVRLGLSNTISIIRTPNELMSTYPAPFFEKLKIFKFLYFFPYFLIGTLIIPTIKGIEVSNFYLQISVISITTIFFSLIIFLNWKNGLKRYEAYN